MTGVQNLEMNGSGPLFVKRADTEGTDMPSNIEAFMFESTKSGLRLILTKVASPIITAAITIPTQAFTDEGEPHCLEHLIFRGSEKYPVPGFIDAWATMNLSDGTNAFTAPDRTAYTISMAGKEGLKQILPVYLDHIFHPLLSERDFRGEVFHVNSKGENVGVVFSEMEARFSEPCWLAEEALHKHAYDESVCYHHCSGGRTLDIANLDNEKVKTMHRRWYRRGECVIHVAGAVDPQDLLPILERFELEEETRGFPARVNPEDWSNAVPKIAPTKSVVDYYPAATDKEDHSVSVAWRVPWWLDLEKRLALELLMDYLMDGSAAPLTKYLVEHPTHAIASDLDFTAPEMEWDLMVLTFQSVKPSETGKVSEAVLRVVRAVVEGLVLTEFADSGLEVKETFDILRMRSLVENHMFSLMDRLERKPHGYFQEIATIMAAMKCDRKVLETRFRDILCDDRIANSLLAKDEKFWTSLLAEIFLGNAPSYSVAIFPSSLKATQKGEMMNCQTSKRLEERGGDMSDSLEEVKDDHGEKELRLMMKGKPSLAFEGNVVVVDGKCFDRASETLPLDSFGKNAFFVDLGKDGRSNGAKPTSDFIDLSIVCHLDAPFNNKVTLKDFLQEEIDGKKLWDAYEPHIRSFVTELFEKKDFDTRWEEKKLKLREEQETAKKVGESGAPLKETSEESSSSCSLEEKSSGKSSDDDSDDDDGADASDSPKLDLDVLWRGLKFVLERCTIDQLLPLYTWCIDSTWLKLPRNHPITDLLIQENSDFIKNDSSDKDIFTVDHTTVDKIVTAKTVEFEIDGGITPGASESPFLRFQFKSHRNKFPQGLTILKAIIMGSDIYEARLVSRTRKLCSHLNDTIRKGEDVVLALNNLLEYGFTSPMNVENLLLDSLICRIVLKFPGVFVPIFARMSAILREKIDQQSLVRLVADRLALFQDANVTRFKTTFPKLAAQTESYHERLRKAVTIYSKEEHSAYRQMKHLYLNLANLDSGHVLWVSPLPQTILQRLEAENPFQYFCECETLKVAESFLMLFDGPVTKPVRDAGFSYHPAYQNALSMKSQLLRTFMCAHPFEAIICALDSLKELLANTLRKQRSPQDCLEETTSPNFDQFKQAKSAAIHSEICRLTSPVIAAKSSFSNWIRRLPVDAHVKLLRRIDKVEWKDFLDMLAELLQALLYGNGVSVPRVLAVLPSNTKVEKAHLCEELGGKGVRLELAFDKIAEIVATTSGDDKESFLQTALEQVYQARLGDFYQGEEDDDSDEGSDNVDSD